MTARPSYAGAERFLPARRSMASLRSAVQGCEGCDLFRDATQAVMGDGPARPRVVLVGEQPGDSEDREGEPFVGPAGRLLDRALAEAEVDPAVTYETKVVKHFRFERAAGGKRRIHKKPSQGQVDACLPWLGAELHVARPDGVVLLGATAAHAVLGASFRLTAERGRVLDWPDEGAISLPEERRPTWALATVHPSSVLRSRERDRDFAAFVADLRVVAELLARPA